MAKEYKPYWEKLLDPRWQKKKNGILERDDYTCLDCGDKTKTLHVHHDYYTKGAEPWEYEDSALRTLCSDCHEARHDRKATLEKVLSKLGCEYLIQHVVGYAFGLLAIYGSSTDSMEMGEEEIYGFLDVNDFKDMRAESPEAFDYIAKGGLIEVEKLEKLYPRLREIAPRND